MTTITIGQDDKKIGGLITQLLRQKGYSVSGNPQGGIINVSRHDPEIPDRSLEEKVMEIGELLYDENREAIYKTILEKVERALIENTLKRTDGNRLKAARILGINRNTMLAKIRKLNIDVGKWKMT